MEQDMPPKRPTDRENILTRKVQDLRMGDHIKSSRCHNLQNYELLVNGTQRSKEFHLRVSHH